MNDETTTSDTAGEVHPTTQAVSDALRALSAVRAMLAAVEAANPGRMPTFSAPFCTCGLFFQSGVDARRAATAIAEGLDDGAVLREPVLSSEQHVLFQVALGAVSVNVWGRISDSELAEAKQGMTDRLIAISTTEEA